MANAPDTLRNAFPDALAKANKNTDSLCFNEHPTSHSQCYYAMRYEQHHIEGTIVFTGRFSRVKKRVEKIIINIRLYYKSYGKNNQQCNRINQAFKYNGTDQFI